MKKKSAFTLAELLIALAILAVIATFTIPKILTANQDAKKKAIFRETIATLSDITQQAAQQGGFTVNTQEKPFFQTRLNYVKRCASDPYAEGCWGVAIDPTNADAYVLPNGASIASINGGGGNLDRETIIIDWNGVLPPNVDLDDQYSLTLCFGPTNCGTGYAAIVSGPSGPGAIGPANSTQKTFNEWVFSN